jgi:hypothetical protein
MTTICSLFSSAILARVLYYLSIGLLIKFVTAFGHLAAVLLRRERLFGQSLPYLRSSIYLPKIERIFCQTKRGKVNPNSDLQSVWGNQWNFQLSFLFQQLGVAGSWLLRLSQLYEFSKFAGLQG